MTTFIKIVALLISFVTTTSCKNSIDITVDISQNCKNNYSTSIHLPYGVGITDARILLLRSIKSLVRLCSVMVVSPHFQNGCKDKCLVVLVIELFNYETFFAVNGGITLNSDGTKIADFYADIGSYGRNVSEHQMHTYLVFSKKFVIDINFSNFSGTIKITATSARSVKNYDNCTPNEVYCLFNGQVFCINKLLECDGNLNCGSPKLYDEYCYNDYDADNLVFTIIYGTLLVAVLIFFFVQLLRLYVPTVAKHFFIFTEDHDYNFVLTSQMLPPLKIYKDSDESETDRHERITRSIDVQVY